MDIDFRPLLLAFALAYAGLAVGSLLIAINMMHNAPPSCAMSRCLGR